MLSLVRILCLLIAMGGGTAAMAAEPCRSVQHLGQGYLVCSFDPAESQIRVYHSDHAGKPYGSFRALVDDLAIDRIRLLFAVNGGMYHDDLSPVGLYVENGIERRKLSSRSGFGNFHLLPNGVFYIDGKAAGVKEAKAYRTAGIKPWYATQSGPLLVIGGKLHPSFLPDSDSFKIRNGVGVDAKGQVHFALSKGGVRFHDFATLFRDALGCDDALFLDGTISSLYAPDLRRADGLFPLGPIVAVVAEPAGGR